MSASAQRRLNVHLWAAQLVLAAAFHLLGLAKLLLSAGDLQQGLGLVARAPAAILGPVGLVELLGSLGVVLPAATGILPRLTPVAAGCLSGVALLGAVMPEAAGGAALVLPNVVLAVLGAFVTWGRVAWAPIAPIGLREDARTDRESATAFSAFAERHFSERTTRKERDVA